METTGSKTHYPTVGWDLNSAEFLDLQKNAMEVGASIHVISNLLIDYDGMVVGEQDKYDFAKIKADEPKEKFKNIILLNYPEGEGSFKKAIKWTIANNLCMTDEFVLSSIGKYKPKLRSELGLNSLVYIIGTKGVVIGKEKQAYCLIYNDNVIRLIISAKNVFGNHPEHYFALEKKD